MVPRDVLRIAVCQFALPETRSRDRQGERARSAWIAELDKQVAAAKEAGADVVVLPAGSGGGPAGVPAMSAWARVAANPRRPFRSVPPESAWADYCSLGCGLAKAHGVYLVPGTVVLVAVAAGDDGTDRRGGRDERGWTHAAGLFSPDGDLVGCQAQGHWPAAALRAGWQASDALSLVDLCGWPTALLLGQDATMPEGHRIAERAGARLAIALTAWPVPFNPWRQVATLWSAVQQTQVPCTEACLIGPLRGHLFAGHSAIYGPCEATPGETGWYAQADDAKSPTMVVASLNRQVLSRVRSDYPIADQLNEDLYRRHFAAVYPDATLRAAQDGEAAK